MGNVGGVGGIVGFKDHLPVPRDHNSVNLRIRLFTGVQKIDDILCRHALGGGRTSFEFCFHGKNLLSCLLEEREYLRQNQHAADPGNDEQGPAKFGEVLEFQLGEEHHGLVGAGRNGGQVRAARSDGDGQDDSLGVGSQGFSDGDAHRGQHACTGHIVHKLGGDGSPDADDGGDHVQVSGFADQADDDLSKQISKAALVHHGDHQVDAGAEDDHVCVQRGENLFGRYNGGEDGQGDHGVAHKVGIDGDHLQGAQHQRQDEHQRFMITM